MSARNIVCIVVAVFVVLVGSLAWSQDAKGAVVLDTSGYWRLHYTHKPIVVKTAGGLKSVRYETCLWINRETPPPARGWQKPDFDDAAWRRLPGTPFPVQRLSWLKLPDLNFGFSDLDMSSPFLAHLAMRGKFRVTDPSKVKGLMLSLAYRGGVVVTLNGTEIARGDLPPGQVTTETLAKDYPKEAFVTPASRPDGTRGPGGNGKPLNGHPSIKAHRDRVELHNRELKNIKVPSTLLRKGVNVLAVSVHRAPYHEIVNTWQKPPNAFVVHWSTCGLLRVRLSADDATGLVPNVQRPKGPQVWNSNPMSIDLDLDWGDPNEKLAPVRLVGTRNGAFSGKVVVGSTDAIKDLSATMSDLRSQRGGRIPSSRVQVRYALSDRTERGASFRYPAVPNTFDALEETPPAEVPVRVKRTGRGTWVLPGQPKCIYGAVQPVWVTVNVPDDATPGEYAGTLNITAGGKRFDVPVALTVCAWRLPDPEHFVTFTELVQSPETVARQYNVPLWSDEHFRLMAKTFKLVRQIGSQTAYLPLITRTNMGNDESMVRWTKKPDGSFAQDFSILERYLDLVIEQQGRPKIVCVYVWDYHTNNGDVPVSGIGADGKLTTLKLPGYTDARSKALWQPVIDGVRVRLKARGLDDAMMFGLAGDTLPKPEVVAFFKEVSPGTPWMIANHQSAASRMKKYATIAFQMDVWATNFARDPEEVRYTGWKLPRPKVHFERNIRDDFNLQTHRFLAEMNITGESRGFARQGADFWPVLKDRRGRRSSTIGERYTSRRNLDIRATMLAPGKDGAVGTHRFEMIREGLQEAEARIFIEKALIGKKITGTLAKRCREVLDERLRAMLRGSASLYLSRGTWRRYPVNPHGWWSGTSEAGYQWFIASGWQERSKKLFDAAAEVAAKLNGR